MRFFLLMISPFVMLLFSCENKQYINTYSNRIDSLAMALKESASGFSHIDTAGIHDKLQLINDLLQNTDSLNNIYANDTVKRIKNINKSYREFLAFYPSLINELLYTQSQLTGFKHDLEKGYLSEVNAILYFEQEKQSVHVILLKVDYFSKLFSSNSEKYQILKLNQDSITEGISH